MGLHFKICFSDFILKDYYLGMIWLKQVKLNFCFSENVATFYWDYAIVLLKQPCQKSAATALKNISGS